MIGRCVGWVTLLSALSACSIEPAQTNSMRCSNGDPERAACADAPPVPEMSYALNSPGDLSRYPYGPESPSPELPSPGATVYLSAAGSRDPEARPIALFWNVQDPNAAYLPLEPGPSAERVSFTPTRPGKHSVTLLVSELTGLRQIAQASFTLAVEPRPCAPDGVSAPCSDALDVPGGSFLMGSPPGLGADNERPMHRATIAPFALDRYEVTVGRVRRFLALYDASGLADGSAAHPAIPGSGWRAEWSMHLPNSRADFAFAIAECGGTWTDRPGPNEARPISCLSWYEAFAFCASEGKRLPTEAEWEYAAAGGDEQRVYPWGAAQPTRALVVFACAFDGDPSCSSDDLPVVGSTPLGVGRFGQQDLAGSVWEWTLDSYAPYGGDECRDCARLIDDGGRVFRGGEFAFDDPRTLRAATRYAFAPAFPDQARGVRCARSAAAR